MGNLVVVKFFLAAGALAWRLDDDLSLTEWLRCWEKLGLETVVFGKEFLFVA